MFFKDVCLFLITVCTEILFSKEQNLSGLNNYNYYKIHKLKNVLDYHLITTLDVHCVTVHGQTINEELTQ